MSEGEWTGGSDVEFYAQRLRAYGWTVIEPGGVLADPEVERSVEQSAPDGDPLQAIAAARLIAILAWCEQIAPTGSQAAKMISTWEVARIVRGLAQGRRPAG